MNSIIRIILEAVEDTQVIARILTSLAIVLIKVVSTFFTTVRYPGDLKAITYSMWALHPLRSFSLDYSDLQDPFGMY